MGREGTIPYPGKSGNPEGRNKRNHAFQAPTREHSQKERKKTDNPREGWENGTPPPHRDFKERSVVR